MWKVCTAWFIMKFWCLKLCHNSLQNEAVNYASQIRCVPNSLLACEQKNICTCYRSEKLKLRHNGFAFLHDNIWWFDTLWRLATWIGQCCSASLVMLLCTALIKVSSRQPSPYPNIYWYSRLLRSRFLSTRPVIKLPSILSNGCFIMCPK